MVTVDTSLLSMEGNTKNANGIKSMVLHTLLSDGIITQEQCDLYEDSYQIVIVKRGWFKTWLDKLKNEGRDATDEYIYKYVNFE